MIKSLVLGGTIATSSLFGITPVELPEMKYTAEVSSQQKAQSPHITKHYVLPTNSSSEKEPFYVHKGQKITIKKSGDTSVYFTLHNKNGEFIGQYSSAITYYPKEDGNVYVQFHVPFLYEDQVRFTVDYTIK
ncbi:hypothetical protein [Priestia taiwanensis]|uniref:Uncharacterized protein n=1 Tax=Priestia taiwanensis TaxID=1347902 RepID=A0A917ER40_9BACI|nr:hypothetical protein [Priestia taiwanensis]MBM7363282.1 hypothetical protein [Priestia taiwanensis]GGE69145.1 hypothetical protein GCM10007140_19010 [Priestia taiwanensis]